MFVRVIVDLGLFNSYNLKWIISFKLILSIVTAEIMNKILGYFIGFTIGCLAMFVAFKTDFSPLAKLFLGVALLIGAVIISWLDDEK